MCADADQKPKENRNHHYHHKHVEIRFQINTQKGWLDVIALSLLKLITAVVSSIELMNTCLYAWLFWLRIVFRSDESILCTLYQATNKINGIKKGKKDEE